MTCEVTLNQKSVDQLKRFPEQVRNCLFNNFIIIAKKHSYPDLIDSLEGKFKPSWECDYGFSIMKDAFLKEAKSANLHHYHFGYLFYKDGYDPTYPGKVSDGIIHFHIYHKSDKTEFRVIEICLEHPSPFKIPYANLKDQAVFVA